MNGIGQFYDKNSIREKQREILDVYREVKGGDKTFGEIARERKCSVDRICELLQDQYLVKGIRNYSFEQLKERNIDILRQRKEFEMFFYYIEHGITLEELGRQYNMSKENVTRYFDKIVKIELSEEQLHQMFCMKTKNYKKDLILTKIKKLSRNLIFTTKEMNYIDYCIKAFQNYQTNEQIDSIFSAKSIEHLVKRNKIYMPFYIETLKFIKTYLSEPQLTMDELCEKYKMTKDAFYERKQRNWISQLLGDEIIAKFEIRYIIDMPGLKKMNVDKINQIDYYLNIFAEFLNDPNITLHELETKYNVDLKDGSTIDQLIGCKIFYKITHIINPIQQKRLRLKNDPNMSLYFYYIDNFVLLKDLEILFKMNQNEIENYFKNIVSSEVNYEEVKQIEQQRKNKLMKNIHLLFHFSQILTQYQTSSELGKNINVLQLETELKSTIGEKNFNSLAKQQNSYIGKTIRAAQFSGLYLYQDNYDTEELKRIFGIRSPRLSNELLYHDVTTSLIEQDVKQYIKTKRSIAANLGRQKYITNKLYLKQERNEKGQFVKKYQPLPNEE